MERTLNQHDIFNDSAFDLDALEHAVSYQRWVADTVKPWLGSRILEVGAGSGNMSRWLPLRERLILTEPDQGLRRVLGRRMADRFGEDARLTITDFDPEIGDVDVFVGERLDTAVSFNVMEHIRDDLGAVRNLAKLLDAGQNPGRKRIVLFVPAHQWAFGSLDAAFDHERRYSRRSLEELLISASPKADITIRHFNAVGLIGWIVAGRLLRRDGISPAAIRAFEVLCPIVRRIDRVLHGGMHLGLGQSLVGVAEWG